MALITVKQHWVSDAVNNMVRTGKPWAIDGEEGKSVTQTGTIIAILRRPGLLHKRQIHAGQTFENSLSSAAIDGL